MSKIYTAMLIVYVILTGVIQLSLDSALEKFTGRYPAPFEGKQGSLIEIAHTFELEGTETEVFQVMSNTSKVNHRLGIAERVESEVEGRLIIDTTFMGMKVQWQELPWKWSFGKYIIADRLYSQGHLFWEHAVFDFESISKNKQKVTFFYQGRARYFWVSLIMKFALRPFMNQVEKTVKEILIEERTQITNEIDIKSEELNQGLFLNLKKRLLDAGVSDSIAEKLVKTILFKEDHEIYRLHVPELSLRWREDRSEMTSAFLLAAKAGVLNICWEVKCPHCRGTRESASKLKSLIGIIECEPCNVKIKLSSFNSIDVCFQTPSEIRKVKNISYCAGEPHKKSHILFNDSIGPNQKISFQQFNLKGAYRVRVKGNENELFIEMKSDSSKQDEYLWMGESQSKVIHFHEKSQLLYLNNSDKEIELTIERLKEDERILSPEEVFSNPVFHRFYQDEQLGSGIQLKLPNKVILFTDVVDSTNFYKNNGDEEAFRQIKLHFDIVSEVIAKHKGMIVKTIGDAVMASFNSVDHLIKAVAEMDKRITSHQDIRFGLRYSAHQGEMIAVNYNTGIDYFGNNVNIAAKLQAIAHLQELSFSETLFNESTLKKLVKFEERAYLNDQRGYVVKVPEL